MSAATAIVPPAAQVGIFWDYENVRIPWGTKSSVAANRIRDAVGGHGQIVERRLYFDSRKPNELYTDRVNLDQGGFTLVDCPTRNRKETLDKKLLVDIMAFACRNAYNGTPSCVVLIASDGDYAYTLNKIRDLGVKTIVIHGPVTNTANVLFESCEHALSFQHDVLCIRREDEDEEEDGSDEFQDAINDALGGRHVVLCHSLAELGSSWVQDARVAKSYYKKRGLTTADVREGGEELGPYPMTRDSAVAGGFIKMGRKELQTGKVVESSGPWDQQSMGSHFSHYLFVRLEATGRRQLEDNAEAMDAITGEPLSPSVDSVTPSEELPMEELQIGGAEAVAAPNAAYPSSPTLPSPTLPQWQPQLGQPGASAIGDGGGSDRGASSSGPAAGGGEGGGGHARHIPGPQHPLCKTILCKRFLRLGQCSYERCGFAHGEGELRPKPSRTASSLSRGLSAERRARSRTICHFVGAPGGCTSGDNCRFLHPAGAPESAALSDFEQHQITVPSEASTS